MGKQKKRKHVKKLTLSLRILLLVIIIVVAVIVVDKKTKENRLNNHEEAEILEEEVVLERAELYQSQEIVIYSLFSSSTMNPDAAMQFGENIATIEFQNISNNCIKKCEIQLTASNGEEYHFLAEDIPAGAEVMAFDTSNKTLPDDVECENISVNVETEDGDTLMSDQLEISVDGIQVSLKNISEADLQNVVVTCHCALDEVCYGGVKYEYSTDKIAAGETIIFNAEDCYIGQAKVVRVSAE